jgi:hypothetical protein
MLVNSQRVQKGMKRVGIWGVNDGNMAGKRKDAKTKSDCGTKGAGKF